MKPYYYLILLLLFSCNKNNEPAETKQIFIKTCEEYAQFSVGEEYYVQNNVWGFYAGSYTAPFSQCIFYDSLQSTTFGWEWELDSISRFPSYPRVGYGWNPWFENSTTEKLPRKLNELQSVKVFFEQEFESNGVYNLSFDIWLSSSATTSEETISAEIMIWLDTNTLPETNLTAERITINGEAYSFYENTSWYSYPLFIFVANEKEWNGQLDINCFIVYLSKYYKVSEDNYLSVVEFGNEIWSGKGRMELKDYRVEVE